MFPDGTGIGAYLRFKIHSEGPILIKAASSFTDMEGAQKNLDTEIPHWDFEPEICTYTCSIGYLSLSGEETVMPECTIFFYFILIFNDKVPVVSGGFSPALIDAVDGIVSAYLFFYGIDFNISFPFITVRIDYEKASSGWL